MRGRRGQRSHYDSLPEFEKITFQEAVVVVVLLLLLLLLLSLWYDLFHASCKQPTAILVEAATGNHGNEM